jgi:Ca2+-binding RTX toxin-like protein
MPTVADFMLDRLRQWGVEHLFAYPGDGINGLVTAFGRADDNPGSSSRGPTEMSALEAVGYTKFRGRPGVCVASFGPGAIHLLNGLYDAKPDLPLWPSPGRPKRTAVDGSYQQEVDLLALFKDVASDCLPIAFPGTATRPGARQEGTRVHLGRCHKALSGRGLRMRKSMVTAAMATGLLVIGTPAWAATITGTAGDDELVGTQGGDVIRARAGDDVVLARAGSDAVYAGPGADIVLGGRGADRLRGGDGPDEIVPGRGADRVRAGFGNDRVAASGDGSSDYINCGPGARDIVWWFIGHRPDAGDVIVNCEVRRRVAP